jgi:UDP-GlcNAc:undecaprenyl-phosphate GlcNAc-1-phosphate transferase
VFTFWPEIVPVLAIFLLLSFWCSFIFTGLTIKLVKRLKILDSSLDAPNRKAQIDAVPLLGATSFIFFNLLFTGILWLLRKNLLWEDTLGKLFYTNNLQQILGTNLEPFKLFWVYVGILIIFTTGVLDDIYKFKSKMNIFPTLFALLIIIFLGGIQIDAVPHILTFGIIPNSDLLALITFLWLGFCLSATKFLDGMDGLVSSVGIISLLIIAGTSSLTIVNQPLIFAISLIWVFGILGFLPYNLPDAKIYLGEAGSQIIGLMIGILSIISGAKVATATTVMGWFILDIILVMLVRMLILKKSPLDGDKLHWHFRLQALGLNKTQILLVTITLLTISGTLGVILPSNQKAYLLLGEIITYLIFFFWSLKATWKKVV